MSVTNLKSNLKSQLTWVGAYNGGAVLQLVGQERSSRILGGVWQANSGSGYVADLTIPGTLESPGRWEISIGLFDDRAGAQAAVIAAFHMRSEDPVAFDVLARVADRTNQPLALVVAASKKAA